MESPYQRIVELFGAPKFEGNMPDALPRRRHGTTAEESRDLGRQSLLEGDYETAIRHFREALEHAGGTSAAVSIDLGGAYEYAEMAPQALRQYERALKAQEDQPEPHVGLSQIYKRYARYKDSLTELEEAIRLEPANAFYHFKLAEILREIGERDRALLAAQGAVAAAPDQAFYHYWLGDLMIELGMFPEALESLRAAIELSPGDDFLYLRAAVAFWGADRRQEAVKAIRIASDLDPDKHLYYGLLRAFLTELGLAEEAALEDKRAHRMDAYDWECLRRIGMEVDLAVD